MRHSDRPIYKPDHDLLDRAGFAHALAESIDKLQVSDEGFVIALTGEWGAGKSSIIELILRRLLHLEMSRKSAYSGVEVPHCSLDDLERYCQQYEKIESIVASLEREDKETSYWEQADRIGQFERKIGDRKSAEDADRYFRLKVDAKREPRIAIVRFSPWLVAGRAELANALLGDIARAAGHVFGDTIRNAFARLLERLAEIAPSVSAGVSIADGSIGRIIGASGTLSGRVAKTLTQGRTLDHLMNELREVLRELGNRRILVVIDDLDRLLADEALEIVSLVKSLGDLPNVVYFLAYDDVRLHRLLKKLLAGQAQDYMAKVVQYSVAVPILPPDALSKMFDHEMAMLLSDPDDNTVRRGQHAWFHILRHYLKTPRDLKLLMNGYRMSYFAMSDMTDPMELLILEVLRNFEPEVYTWIRQNIGGLT